MDEELISPLETLMSMGAGGMMYAVADNAGARPQLVLMVRDDPAHLATIPQDPPILAQVSLFRIDGVLLAPLVVKLGNPGTERPSSPGRARITDSGPWSSWRATRTSCSNFTTARPWSRCE